MQDSQTIAKTHPSEEAAPSGVTVISNAPTESRSLWQLALIRLRGDKLTLFALFILAVLMILSFSAPIITSALKVDYRNTNAAEGKYIRPLEGKHLLGTDHLGRDEFARLLYAGRVSIGIGVIAGLCAIFLGTSIGLVAGYNQGGKFGFLDDFIIAFVTTLNSIPSLLLLILLASVLAPTKTTLIFVLVIISWSGTMRLVRGETLSHREREYVISARSIGAGSLRIMFTHILPNIFSVFIVALALEIGTLILVEAALSFLGLGVRPPEPSWGNMLTEAQRSVRQAAHLSIFPGVLITTTVLCLYIVGDGLRDAFDPQAIKK